MRTYKQMAKEDLIRRIEELEKVAHVAAIAFEHERLLHELETKKIALEKQNDELRHTQTTLENSRKRYADLYDFAPVGYVTFDGKGVVREINLTAASMLGVERERLIDQPFQPFVAEENLAHFGKQLGKRNDPKERLTCELRLVCKDGSTIPVVMQSVLIRSGGKKDYVCSAAFTDITARKRAEHLLTTLMENLPDKIYFKDKASRFVLVNRAKLAKHGLTDMAQMMGKTDFDFFPEERAQQAFDDEQRIMRTGEPLEDQEEKDVWPDGRETWVSTTKLPLLDESGRVVGTFGLSRDITEHKQRAQLLAVQYAVTLQLAESRTLEEALIKILKAICDTFSWDWAAFWSFDAEAKMLRWGETWYSISGNLKKFAVASRALTFAHGDGLPGRAWVEDGPLWIRDVVKDKRFKRAAAAERAGLHGACALPIYCGKEIAGVIELFSEAERPANPLMTKMLMAVAAQINQFLRHKQMEENLSENVELNQSILNSLDAHIAVVDRTGKIIAVNSAWKRFAQKEGAASLSHNSIGINYGKVCQTAAKSSDPVAKAAWKGIDSVLRRAAPSFSMEYPCHSPKKSRWFLMNITPLSTARGDVVISHVDITQRYLVEEAIFEKEARLRAILDTANDGIITIDEHCTIKSFNQAAEKIFGYRALEAVGKNVSLLMPSPDREKHDGHIARYLRTGQSNIIGSSREVVGLRKDGTTFPMEIAVSDLKLAGHHIFTGIVRDITPRKKAEQALLDERNFISAVLDTSGALILLLDEAGRIVRFNRACEHASGYLFDEVRGKTIWKLLVPPEEIAGVQAAFEQARTTKIPVRHENQWLAKNGRHRLISWSNTVMTGEDGSVTVIATGIDITFRRRLESEVIEISESEQRRIGQNLHDGLFRKLAGVQQTTDLIAKKRTTGSVTKAEIATVSEQVRETITETQRLVRSLSPTHLESNDLVASLAELAANTEQLFKVGCKFACPRTVEIVDKMVITQLYRIAQEAIHNAIKHGGAKNVTVTLTASDDRCTLAIANDGFPFPEEAVRSEGLGLRIMKYRAGMLGGSLTIDSGKNGSTVATCAWKI